MPCGDRGDIKCVQHSPRRMQIQVASWELVSSAGKEVLCLHGRFISPPWLDHGIYSPKNSYFPWIHPIMCVLGAPALTPPLNHPLKTHRSQILSACDQLCSDQGVTVVRHFCDTFFFPLFPLFGEEPSSQRAPCVSRELRHGGKVVSRALTCTG